MRTQPIASLFCTTALFCLIPSSLAQVAPSFPDEPYVITKALTSVSMNADATGTRVITFAVRIQSQAALQQFSVATISFASQAEKADFVYVRAIHSDGTTQETDVAQTIEQPAPVTQQAPFYSDLEIKQLPVKSLRVGDTLEWQARFIVEHPEVPGQIWGQDSFIQNAVSLNETYELRVPSSLHLTAWTNPRFKDTFSESTDAGIHIYRWHHAELKPTVGAQADSFRKAEETRRRTPDEELDLTKGELPSLAWTSFADWAAVGAWYKTLTADRITPDPAIRAKVAELTVGKTTDLEKAQAVYNYVSAHIRYIGVAFGIGRYQPHTAAEILANQYGDCKDKHTLLASMLSVLNLHADPVLIGAGIRFNSAVPSPAAFNHLITRINLAGSEVWLDSTAEVGPWGALFRPIRDHEALAMPASSPAIIVRTPVDLPYPSFSTSKVVGSLDKDLTSDSTMVLTYRGDDEIAVRAVFRSVSPSNYGQFVQQLMAGMGFGGTTSDPSFEHFDDTTQPIQLSFHYHRLKDKDWGENRITAIFQQISLPSFTEENPPIIAIELGTVRTETSTVEMKLPPDWHVRLPAAVHAHAAFATCDVTYRTENGALIAERRLAILQSKVPVDDFKKYQAWYDETGASNYSYIELIPPIKSVGIAVLPQPEAPAASATVQSSDPRAAELVQKAFESVRSMDLDAARKNLDQAREINPTEPHLWGGYAAVAQMLGKPSEIIADAQHELSFHPEEVDLYSKLAQEQMNAGDSQAALVTLRSWVKAAPADSAAPLALVHRLQLAHLNAEAYEVAHAAIVRLASSAGDITPLRIAGARAQADLGHSKEAAVGIAALLPSLTDPVLVHNAAYVLAEAGVNLPEASAALAKVLDATASETATWTLTENVLPFTQKQNQMAAEWDTMAWILYRQGKFSQALGYATAAIHVRDDDPSVRKHLAAITTALHSPAASELSRQSNQHPLTLSLGPAKGRNGALEFVMLLANGKVITDIPQPGSNARFDAAEDILKSADLHALFPPGSTAHLIRVGFVHCTGQVCDLNLEPMRILGER